MLHNKTAKVKRTRTQGYSLAQNRRKCFIKAEMSKRTVLITGCSDGGLGAALALEMHSTGSYRVIASARNPNKLAAVKQAGIETIILDVLSESSIASAVTEISKLTGGSLDILVNNAGASTPGPVSDMSVPEAKRIFDLNVWSPVVTTQAFLPLILKSSRGMIVNHTSVASVITPPFNSSYGASKAALAMITTSLRVELHPFGIAVVDLKSGAAKSNIVDNSKSEASQLRKKSLYYAAHDWLDEWMSGEDLSKTAITGEAWAKSVTAQLSRRNPPNEIWVGSHTWLVWFATWMPVSIQQWIARDMSKIPLITKKINEYGRDKAIANAYGHLE